MEIYRDDEHWMPVTTPPARPRGRARAVLLGSALTGALIVGGGAYAMADETTPAPSPSSSGTAVPGGPQDRPGPPGQGRQQGRMPDGRQDQREQLGRPIHGDMVLDKDGTYTTVRMQQGTVTAKTGTSLTVKSSDGYEQTYTLNDSTQYGGGPGGPGTGGPGGRGGHGRGHHGDGPGVPGQGRQGGNATAAPTGGAATPPSDGQAPPAETTHTLADVKVGDTVHVLATVKDGKGTAVRVHDEAWRPAGTADCDGKGPQQGGAANPSPVPADGSTATAPSTSTPTDAQSSVQG